MDIWKWVNEATQRLEGEGQTRLRDLMNRLASHVCDDQHERADAIVPEALALARAARLPWVEVFVRHWHLQSRVLHRMEGRSALDEAVSLLEFAHREDTRDCPQSVCAVQDLAACYGIADGPGFADERMAVSLETLGRIDPTWPCFVCISGEYAQALHEKGNPAEALAFLDAQVARMTAARIAGARPNAAPQTRVEVLFALERYDDALAFLDECASHGRDDVHARLERRLERARALAETGRLDEAYEALPSATDVGTTPSHYGRWAPTVLRLVRGGRVPYAPAVVRTLLGFASKLSKNGAPRKALEMAQGAGELALENGALAVARVAVGRMEAELPALHRTLDARDRVERLRRAIAAREATEPAPDPASAEAILETLQAAEPPREDVALELTERGVALFPESSALALAYVDALSAFGFEREARVALEARYAEGPFDPSIGRRLGLTLLAPEDRPALEAHVAGLRERARSAVERAAADELLAHAAFRRDDYEDCILHVRTFLEAVPDAVEQRRMGAAAAARAGEFGTALAWLEDLVRLVPEPGAHDWERIVVASVVDDWAALRASAARLDLGLEGEGPVDDDWGHCLVRTLDPEGAFQDDFAARSGPATARILTIAPPGREQHFGDVVVLRPRPLNAKPATPEEEAEHLWLFPFVSRKAAGGYWSFEIDGPHPGAEAWSALASALVAAGCVARDVTSPSYRVASPGSDERDVAALYALVAVPGHAAAEAIHRVVTEATEGFALPLTWRELARRAGSEEALARMEELAVDYQL